MTPGLSQIVTDEAGPATPAGPSEKSRPLWRKRMPGRPETGMPPQEWERHLFGSVWLLVCFLLMGDIFEHSLCVCVCRASSMITVTSAAQ